MDLVEVDSDLAEEGLDDLVFGQLGIVHSLLPSVFLSAKPGRLRGVPSFLMPQGASGVLISGPSLMPFVDLVFLVF